MRSTGVRIALAGSALLALAGLGAAVVFYWLFLRDLPDLRSVGDYHPPLASRVLDREGRPIGEFFTERRHLAALDQLPAHVVQAFVAGEDSSFFEHSGLDYQSILRAAWVNLRAGGEIRQGGSTITQQVVKGLLLSPERRLRRKIREMILARRIEQHFSKQEILYLYLNQIYFGHGAYGIEQAARSYFGKPAQALTVSEGALLAGLPKAPSRYSPYANPEEAERRRRYVLARMLEDAFIDPDTYVQALAEAPALAGEAEPRDFQAAAYFTEEVRRSTFEALGGEQVLKGGLVIETTLDLELQRAAVKALRKGLAELDQRQGYRGPLRRVGRLELPAELERLAAANALGPAAPGAPVSGGGPGAAEASAPVLDPERTYEGVVLAVDGEGQTARVGLAPGVEGLVRLADVSWAREPDPSVRARPVRSIDRVFSPGDVAAFVRLDPPAHPEEGDAPAHTSDALHLTLHQEPIVEGALLSIDVGRDEVLALVGGYDFGRSQFDRVTQARRQPGSAFKPLIYGAALERGYTAASIVHDRPVVYVDETSGFTWRPRNYGRKFYGPMTLREALARSVNNATLHLFRDVGVGHVIDYARRLGIESPLNRDLSLALGSSDVSLLELTRAYATFPAAGRRVVPVFIRRVTDRDGRVLLENVALGAAAQLPAPADEAAQEAAEPALAGAPRPPGNGDEPADGEQAPFPPGHALSPEQAFLVTDLLRAVVVDPEGTGWRLRALGRPVAGKTGTTNDQADAWFMGFSPDLMTGVWVGHDESRFLGWGETGSRAAAPIWVDFMEAALAGRPVRDFAPPEPIVFARIDRKTGLLADATSANTVFQAFLSGTEPTRTAQKEENESNTRRMLRLDSF